MHFFIGVCRNKRALFLNDCIKPGYHLYHYSCQLIAELFSGQMNLKNKVLQFFCTSLREKYLSRDQNRKESPFIELSCENDRIKKHQVIMTKGCLYKWQLAGQKSILNFSLKKQITSFSHLHSIWFTNEFQHFCFLAQANLYRLSGIWQ